MVATNPLFPKQAILQRLEWAGLPAEEVPFDLIPSYETFHFAKPNPAYYSEILAQLGAPSQPAIMIGNDFEMDIFSAIQAGLPSFWLTSNNGRVNPPPARPTGIGDLPGLIEWLDEIDPSDLKANTKEPASLLATLRATPARVIYRVEITP